MEADRNRGSEEEERKVGGDRFSARSRRREPVERNWVVRGGVSKCD